MRGIRNRHRSAAVALLTGAALALSGCGATDAVTEKATEKAVEEMAEAGASEDVDIDVDSESGEMTIESEDGSMSIGAGGELPEQFPDDVPVPDGDFEITMSMATDAFVQVTLLADGDLDEFADMVEQGLQGAGYTIGNRQESSMGDHQSRSLTAEGNDRSVYVGISDSDDEQQKVLTYRIEKVEQQ